MSSICLVVLCGLPGSGKSTLANHILTHFIKCDKTSLVHVLSYDEFLPQDLEATLLQSKEQSAWKSYRNGILQCVQCLLQHSTENGGTPLRLPVPSKVDEELWRRFHQILARSTIDTQKFINRSSSS
ncbi:hypothetical protein ScPMuIL_000193 [Solemya velum]